VRATASCLGHQRLVYSNDDIEMKETVLCLNMYVGHVCRNCIAPKESALSTHARLLKNRWFSFRGCCERMKKKRTKMFSIYKRGNS
jgi:hypothetical protein